MGEEPGEEGTEGTGIPSPTDEGIPETGLGAQSGPASVNGKAVVAISDGSREVEVGGGKTEPFSTS
jgi:hypothetical protein